MPKSWISFSWMLGQLQNPRNLSCENFLLYGTYIRTYIHACSIHEGVYHVRTHIMYTHTHTHTHTHTQTVNILIYYVHTHSTCTQGPHGYTVQWHMLWCIYVHSHTCNMYILSCICTYTLYLEIESRASKV